MLKTTTTAIDELEAALSKVKLATKLGCNASELTHRSIDVSTDKIGRVIGKNGSTIKQLESEQKVAMDVDSVAGKIHLTGTEAAIALAITEIEKICTAIDVDVKVPIDLLSYFTTKVSAETNTSVCGWSRIVSDSDSSLTKHSPFRMYLYQLTRDYSASTP